MTREVVSLRLSDEEKAAIELAAKREGLRPSEFLRRAGLMVAHRLKEAAKPKPRPAAPPQPRKDDGPHFSRTCRSFAECRSGGVGGSERDYGAEAAPILRRSE